jgi:hypothetical protein
LVINLYFSLGGWPFFQILRQPFLLIFSFKNSKRYQIAVSDLVVKPRGPNPGRPHPAVASGYFVMRPAS